MARNKYPEETYQLILDVSTRLFFEKGYERTSLQDIIDGLGGLTKGAIYYHFRSKEEILMTDDGRTIVFTRKDVREIRLAKAAIRAGAETLMLRYGVKKEQIARVYLAGGFGYKLDKEKAIAIGMLPAEFRDRIDTVGNSSLSGAAAYLKNSDGEAALGQLIIMSSEINLSSDKEFNEFYMDYMMFE